MTRVVQTITRAVEVLAAIADDLERVSSEPLPSETVALEQRTAAHVPTLAADRSAAAAEHLPPPTAQHMGTAPQRDSAGQGEREHPWPVCVREVHTPLLSGCSLP